MQLPRMVKYLISGCTGAVVNLSTFYVLNDIIGLWYLLASVFAFLVALVVGFILQRFWTFEHTSGDELHRHAFMYVATAVGNVCINAGIVYGLVEVFDMWALVAQGIAAATVAMWSFFIYKHVIFIEKLYEEKNLAN